jgi:Na+-driven multidrug efflux pump
MISAKTKSIDMTSGAITKKMIFFVLPLMATNLLQFLYNAADVMIAGLSSDPNAIGAVGSSGAYLSLIINIFIGFSVGADVVVARNIGAKDSDRISKSAHTAICMSVIFGILGSIVGIALARPMLLLMGYKGNLLSLALLYTYIYLLGLPFASLTNFLSAIMRAKGDTKTPMYVLSFTGLLNVFLNLLFVLALDMAVAGVAIATAISNLVSAAILFYILMKDQGDCKISLGKLRPSKTEFIEICHIGFPSGIQNAFFSISNMLIQSSLVRVDNMIAPPGSEYAPVIKGDSAASSIENFAFAIMNPVAQAASTFVSQNVGVGDYRRVKKIFGISCILAVAVAASVSSVTLIFHAPLLELYGVKSSADILSQIAYNTALTRLWLRCALFFLISLMNTTAGILRGLGRSVTSAVISFVGTCIFRVIWVVTVFEYFMTLESIYASYSITWILTSLTFLICIASVLRKKIKEQDGKTAEA